MHRPTPEELQSAATSLVYSVNDQLTNILHAMQFGVDIRIVLQQLYIAEQPFWDQFPDDTPTEGVIVSAYYALQVERGLMTLDDVRRIIEEQKQFSLDSIVDFQA